jgi:hypothetical protein
MRCLIPKDFRVPVFCCLHFCVAAKQGKVRDGLNLDLSASYGNQLEKI